MAIETNVDPIDWWSFVHFVAPLVLGYILGRMSRDNPKWKKWGFVGLISFHLIVGILILVAWEIGELTNFFEWLVTCEESIANMIADLLIGVFGLCIGVAWGERG